jgi:hypothetical protein
LVRERRWVNSCGNTGSRLSCRLNWLVDGYDIAVTIGSVDESCFSVLCFRDGRLTDGAPFRQQRWSAFCIARTISAN